MEFQEKRSSVRFTGEIPVQLEDGMGLTRNCCAGGFYILTNQHLIAGQHIEYVLHLQHAGRGYPLRLTCRGEVLRVEPGPNRTGVAVTLDSHWFE